MKKAFLILILILLNGCKRASVSEDLPSGQFSGYGVVKFSKSFSGSIRYMEFYPIMAANYPDNSVFDKKDIVIKNGMVIRGFNSTKLWQGLFQSNNFKPDEFGFYKSLIFINLSNSTLKYNYERPIPNELIIDGKFYKTRLFDYTDGKLNVADFKIIRAL